MTCREYFEHMIVYIHAEVTEILFPFFSSHQRGKFYFPMVDWLELSRGVAVDFLKLIVAWYAEWSRVKSGKNTGECPYSGTFFEDSAKQCFQQLASSAYCEREKGLIQVELDTCKLQSCWKFFWLGLIVGCILFGLSIPLTRRLTRVTPVLGSPIDLPVKWPVKQSTDWSDDGESDTDSILAARQRARTLRG